MKTTQFGLLFAAMAAVFAATPASAELIYALTTQNDVAVFDSAEPSILLDGGAVGNLPDGVDLEAIDYRPATGAIYLLDNMENVYTFNSATFDATIVGTFSPRIPGVGYAFDFNPAFRDGEFARIITDTNDNRVISGDTGQYLPPVEKTDVFYAVGDPHEGQDPNVSGIAYTNSLFGATSTQQYGIDSDLQVLVTVANNAGTLETVGSLGTGVLTNELGFDISGFSGVAYAALQTGPNSILHTIDLTTGAATAVDIIGSGDLIRSLTVIPVPEPTAAVLAALAGLATITRRRS